MSEQGRPRGILWACVEDGFHVGSRDGDFLGYVDRQASGVFRAFDARSVMLGDYEALAQATSAVASATAQAADTAATGEAR